MTRYVPILQDLAAKYPVLHLDEIWERADTLDLIAVTEDESERVTFRFDAFFAFRKVKEGDALQTLATLTEQKVEAKFYYRVEDSEFVRWFHEESYHVREGQPAENIMLMFEDDVVEVIAMEPVQVTTTLVAD